MPAAGIRSGARPCASTASAIARSGSASSAACAWAVSSTARRRSATAFSSWPWRLASVERFERAGPVGLLALQVEQGIRRPAELRVQAERPLGVLAGGFPLALALGLEEQAAQAELLGVGARQHGIEYAPGRRAVAGQLGGLGAQQMRQRLVRQRLAGLDGVAGGERAVTGTDRDHAGRQRVEAALVAPLEEERADGGRALP